MTTISRLLPFKGKTCSILHLYDKQVLHTINDLFSDVHLLHHHRFVQLLWHKKQIWTNTAENSTRRKGTQVRSSNASIHIRHVPMSSSKTVNMTTAHMQAEPRMSLIGSSATLWEHLRVIVGARRKGRRGEQRTFAVSFINRKEILVSCLHHNIKYFTYKSSLEHSDGKNLYSFRFLNAFLK